MLKTYIGCSCFHESARSFIMLVCHLSQKKITMAISLELWVLGLWYFTWKFLMTRPFISNLDLEVKNFNLGYISRTVSARALVSLWQDLSIEALSLFKWPWCLTYLSKNILGYTVLGIWNFTCTFLMTRPFIWDLDLRPSDLEVCCDLLFKKC